MKQSTIDKYKLVIDEWFVNGWNGTKAYLKYYPNSSDETAATEFYKILIGSDNHENLISVLKGCRIR